MMHTSRVVSAFAAALLLAGGSHPVAAQAPQEEAPRDPKVEAAWQAMTDEDLIYLERVIRINYIYAVYPSPKRFDDMLDRSMAQARSDVRRVKNFGGYRAVLQYFISSFADAHFSAHFNVVSREARWPGFTVRYAGAQYQVAKSAIPGIKAGEVIETCDGRNLNSWTDSLAPIFGGPPGRETTHAGIAGQFMVDRDNPLYGLPKKCTISGHMVPLTWRLAPEGVIPPEPVRTSSSAPTIEDDSVGTMPFGKNDAWVRIGTMMPVGARVHDFRKLIREAPALRGKGVVVIDVRGNGGGVYNWFMAFLRSFYGQEYADYYARARLEISNVMYTPPGSTGVASEAYLHQAEMNMPPDPPLDQAGHHERIIKLQNGGRLQVWPAAVSFIRYPSSPPPDLVKARVYLLADYGCGSACLSFVDEMMRFPGVTLIGAETHVDRRSGGWPVGFELPSGLAVVQMGRMVRQGRARGANEAWVPATEYHFSGDIADTSAVERWVLNTVIPRDEARRQPWRQTATLKGPER